MNNCRWYYCEDADGDYVRCTDGKGFCIMQDLFTDCFGKCAMFDEDTESEEKREKNVSKNQTY